MSQVAAGEAEECLHCAIMEMVDERVAAGPTDAVDLTARIAEALVEVILLVPEDERAQLLAQTLSAIGEFYLTKSGHTDESQLTH